ncbi:MAG TPA: universal stress protein [Caulobacteraceae bacterium]|nr:universal stress protein [Caulobacteraceae bacterium]
MALMGFSRTVPPAPQAPVGTVLLASEGRAFSTAAIERAASLAAPGAVVEVLSIARIWGTALGFPNPWLLPSRHEWEAQRAHVDRAITALAGRGVRAAGRVIGSRNAAGKIAAEARRIRAEAIVMGADRGPPGLFASLLWSNEPYRVGARARLPVALAVE